MYESISVRAYRPVEQTHSHHFHQVVVPLQGAIAICINDAPDVISAGHCIVINRHTEHSFSAQREARFLVVDLCDLPDSAKKLNNSFAIVSKAFRSFCLFAELQLKSHLDIELERNMIAVFKQLLTRQDYLPEIDRRISRAITHIESNISSDLKLGDLATISSLSVSQFKVLFTKYTGTTVGEYLLMLRMERARALLVNTDTPMSIVAESSGYKDQSAFTRRFRLYYGVPPSQYKKH